jgi:hypothetical protein
MGKLDRYTIVIDGDNQKLELAAKKTIGDLGRVGKAANDSNGNVSKLAAGVRHASTNVAAFQGPLGGISGRLGALSTMLGSINPAMVGFGLSLSGATLFITSAVAEFDQLNLRTKKAEAQLKATGYVSGFTSDQLDRMAKSTALNTLASVDGIKDSQNALLKFKRISKDVFSDTIERAQDLTAVMGNDVKSATNKLGEALETPSEGMKKLERYIGGVSDAEISLMRDMENAGRVMDSQRYALDLLQNKIGGAGAAEAEGTVVGAVDTLDQRWQSLKVNVADTSGAATGMQWFVTKMGEVVHEIDQMIAPSDESRLAELWVESQGLRNELDALASGSDRSLLSYIVGTDSESLRINSQLSLIKSEMAEIEGRQAVRKQKQKEADDAATENQRKISEESLALKAAADAKDLARIHDKGAAAVAAMEMQFADEEEKINLNYDKNLLRIESWQVSEAELKRRGYEDMEALRDEYRLLAGEKMDQDFFNLETKMADQNQKLFDQEQSALEKKQKMIDRANAIKFSMEKKVQGNLLRLGHTLAGENKKLQLAMLAIETTIGAKEAVVAGYVGGAKAAAAMAPMGPAAAAAANADMIRMGYTNAALIGATGIAQGISLSNGGDTGGAVGSSFESGVEPTVQSNDEAVTSINSAAERRAGGDVVYNGPYIEKVEAMDSESFDDFAQRNSNSIARATAAGYEEYGVNLSA